MALVLTMLLATLTRQALKFDMATFAASMYTLEAPLQNAQHTHILISVLARYALLQSTFTLEYIKCPSHYFAVNTPANMVGHVKNVGMWVGMPGGMPRRDGTMLHGHMARLARYWPPKIPTACWWLAYTN